MITVLALATIGTSADAQWTEVEPIPTAREHSGFAVLDSELYVLGGHIQFFGVFGDHNESYDLATDTWTVRAPLPQPLYGAGAASALGQVFAIGGRTLSGSVVAVEAYNPLTDTWVNKAPMTLGKDSFVTAEVNGIIYAIGGYLAPTDQRVADVQAYDPLLDQWTTLSPLNHARADAAGAAVGSKIYVFGGYDGNPYYLDFVEEFDTTTGIWTDKSPMPTARAVLRAAVLDGLIYVMGGNNDTLTTLVEIYDPQTDSWSSGVSLPNPRGGFATGTLGNTIVIASGITDNGGIQLTAETDALSISPPDAPDLEVTNITTTNNKAPQGSKVTITATVSNTGNAAAGASTTLFLNGTTVIGSANTPAIPAGGSVDVSVDWRTAGIEGSHILEARADSTNAVTESDEGNNAAQVTVTVNGNKVQ